jgi:hypothetical protein
MLEHIEYLFGGHSFHTPVYDAPEDRVPRFILHIFQMIYRDIFASEGRFLPAKVMEAVFTTVFTFTIASIRTEGDLENTSVVVSRLSGLLSTSENWSMKMAGCAPLSTLAVPVE